MTTFSALLLSAIVATAPAASKTTIIGTSGPNGFVGNFLELAFPGTHYIVASDGESSFDPFQAGFDTSDGIDFSGVGFQWFQHGNAWTSLGNQRWVLPASIPGCGTENATTCEPLGHFYSPSGWSPNAIGTWVIKEQNGSTSDIIRTFNDASGRAVLYFQSDPSTVPEPAGWALMIAGFGLTGAAMRRRHIAVAA